MVWNGFPQALALDETTGDIARNIVGQVYALADLTRSTPLPMQDPTGQPLVGATSNRLGLIQRFRVETHKIVVWRSGTHEVEIISLEAVIRDVEAAQAAALSASVAAAESASAAAALGVGQDAAVAGYVLDPDSETHEAVVSVAGTAAPDAGSSITAWSQVQSLSGFPEDFPTRADLVTETDTRKVLTADERTKLAGAATGTSVSTLASRVTSLETLPRIYWKNAATDPTPAGARTDIDVVLVRTNDTAPPPGGGNVDLSVLRRLLGEGVADGAQLETTVGTNDTAPDVVSSTSILWQVAADGERELEIINAQQAYTFRWSTGLPALTLWSFDFYLRVAAYPTASSTIMGLTGVCGLSLGADGALTVLNSALTGAAPSSVGGTAGSKSPVLALNTGTNRYRVKGWRTSTATGTLSKFRLYDPAGALIWDVSRDVGVSSATAFLLGRTGITAGGNHFFNRVRLDDAGAELVGV